MKRPTLKQIAERVLEIQAEIDATKPLYAELDRLVQDLVDREFVECKVGRSVVRLVDRYADKNTAWKATAIRRFDLQIFTT